MIRMKRKLLLFLVAVSLGGCGSWEMGETGSLPSLAVERSDLQGRVLVPSSRFQGSPGDEALSEVASRVRAQVSEALGNRRNPLLHDRGLDAACRRAAEALALGPDMDIAPTSLRTELQAEQISDVSYLPFTFHVPMGALMPESALAFIQEESRHRGITHLGVGVARSTGRRALVTLVLLRRLVSLSAFPYQVREGSRHYLWVHPASSLVNNPRVLLADPRGAVVDLPVTREGSGVSVRVPFDQGSGRYVLQVLADNSFGTQVTNQMDVWIGEPRRGVAESPQPTGDWSGSRSSQEARMMALLNAYRSQNGLPRLRHDDGLAATARAHSEDMRDHRFFGHRSPRHGDLGSRVSTIRTSERPLVLENIAMSVSVTWAHDGLVASPSHRRNLLDARVTHAGVGVAVREAGPIRVVYVTQHMGALAGGGRR